MMRTHVLEGTWEEIKRHDTELAGRWLKVIVRREPQTKTRPSHVALSEEVQPLDKPKTLRGCGMLAHIPGGSEAYALEKQEEIDREDRKFD